MYLNIIYGIQLTNWTYVEESPFKSIWDYGTWRFHIHRLNKNRATDAKWMMEQFIKGRMKVFAKDVITTFQGWEDIHRHESTTKKGFKNENSNNISYLWNQIL